MRNSPFKFNPFFFPFQFSKFEFWSFQSSNSHSFSIVSIVSVPLVVAVHLPKWRRFEFFLKKFLISKKLKNVN